MISSLLNSLMVLLFWGIYIQYFLLRLARFSPAHFVPASPAVPSQSGTAPLPWASQRLFLPATAWRNLLGKGWETLHRGAYCTLKYELAEPCWLSPGSKGVIKFLSQFKCITRKFPGCKNENMKWCDTVWLSNFVYMYICVYVYLSFQSGHWKIDPQRSGSWEWHRWGVWGWSTGGPVGSRRRCWKIGHWGLLRHQWQHFPLKHRRAEGRVELE